MKADDAQQFKQEKCTKREEFDALRNVIPSMRIDTERLNSSRNIPQTWGQQEEGTFGVP